MSPDRVVVAMSGGVDSSVAAALLKEDGYEVIGITMQIWPSDETATRTDIFNSCCSLKAAEDARRVAQKLEISHYMINFREVFARQVITNFYQEYTKGRTPNPCIRCNQYIKSGPYSRKLFHWMLVLLLPVIMPELSSIKLAEGIFSRRDMI